MKAQMKLAAVAGVLSLLVSGLPLACEGLTSNGDIKGSAVDPNWTQVSNSTFGSKAIRAIAYGNGRFVAVGQDSYAAWSTDGISWTAVGNTTLGTSQINAIAYGGGKFVMVSIGSRGAAYSTDGINWTQVNTTFSDGCLVMGMVYVA